jgi:hypothetical protein
MRYLLKLPDTKVHDEATCAGPPHCKVNKTRESWDAAYPLWQTTTSELEACRVLRARFPDALGMPCTFTIGGEDVVGIIFMKDAATIRKIEMLKIRPNPVAILEVVPEDRDERKLIKTKRVFDRHLWMQGWVPALDTILFERTVVGRSSLAVGPEEVPVQFGVDKDGQWTLQLPGTISFALPDEFVEQIVVEYVKKHGTVREMKVEVVPDGP